MIEPLVSIIIPVYNAEKYLEETIISAINQTWPNKEIIIVDDGSTDNSLSIAKKYQADWIKVFTQQNKGASAARNKGLLEANGGYIQFLDADDLLSTNKIHDQVNLLNKNPGYIAVCSTIHFKDKLRHNDAPSLYEESFLLDDNDAVHFLIKLWGGYSAHGSMVQPNAWLTPKSIIDKAGLWDEELTVDDDGEFFCRAILNSNGIKRSAGFNFYRKHNNFNNLSAQTNQKDIQSRLQAILYKKKYLLEKTNCNEAKLAIYKLLTNILVISYLHYPDIYKTAKAGLPAINTTYKPPMGGTLSNAISKILGWKTFKFIQHTKNALLKR